MRIQEFKANKPEFDKYIQKLLKGEAHLSFSSFKNFMQSPYKFFEYKMFPKESTAMNAGSSFHMCVLEKDKYDEMHVIFDDTAICAKIGGAKPRSTKLYKEWKTEYEAKHEGKIIISKAVHENYLSMAEYLNENNLTSSVLCKVESCEEKVTVWIEGLKFIGYVDAVADQFTIDLKKLADVSDKRILWNIKDNLYDYQGAIYAKSKCFKQHFIVCISDSHDVNVVEITKERLEHCEERLVYFIDKFRECIETDSWLQGSNFFKETHLHI